MVKLIWMIFLITELRATITQGPSNSVAEIGGQVKLNCVATNPIGYWVWSKNGTATDEVTLAGPGCSIRPAFVDHYAVESLGGGTTCNLIVFNITMAQAGVYRCLESPSEFLSILTVIDSFPAIYLNSSTTVVENESVIIECVLNHNGSVPPAPTLRPYFYWTDFNALNVSSSYDSTTENTAVSKITVTAGPQDIMPFTCHVYFQLIPPTNPNYAGNIPTVNKSASSPTIEVIYPVQSISIISTVPPQDKCISKLETLTCTADANPPAQYIWTDLKDNINTTGAAISISSGGEYQCTAYNYIRNQTYYDTKSVTETSCHSPFNLTINGTNCENNFCTCNGNASSSDPISITCKANGIPTPSVKWRSDNSFDGLYETIGVTYDGNYTCISSNTYGGLEYSAELTIVVYDCLAPPTKLTTTLSTTVDPASISPTMSTMANTNATTVSKSNSVAAIVMGVLFGISLVVNIILLIMLIRKQDSSKRKDNIPEPQMPHYSDPFAPAAYEELRPNDGIHLQPTTYEQLQHRPPLYVNHVS